MTEILVRKDGVESAEWISLTDLRNMLKMLDIQERKQFQALELDPPVAPI